MADGGRTPAQIEADIVRRRQELAVTLDEIGVRLHPKTIAGNARASARQAVDRTAGRAYVTVNRVISSVRGELVAEDGSPRMERVVPAAIAAVALVALLAGRSSKRKKKK
ncbi:MULTISPECIES: DUF3618 domain-containing protein [Streptomycetaceae]|uniref:DUF3618 domain-containing protein n=1 Tax=Streptantibioticus cattleyicolor (strain ATCC 35852 / DSM 46488 / JCM 4925 / NBRC 14057 / NRRL 8057) TaxID=1003195 RepID=F8JTE1_STREN|nr:DUF3618 domain-containing protein [Streptantibioticus cattleyicolor]AEW94294.1 hypothetical protein SCATT_19230 [Streptantibioticus cattleyicolor NRRL 8057 = DSM 46488]MYS58950.1 DUF3618 domain-containing protein [Streptomyces sp. SID5468]CCB74651.1 conserved protein of unknown function [Streptantibioticus cattleyicolor NRRL 8057 = DSM 46488]